MQNNITVLDDSKFYENSITRNGGKVAKLSTFKNVSEKANSLMSQVRVKEEVKVEPTEIKQEVSSPMPNVDNQQEEVKVQEFPTVDIMKSKKDKVAITGYTSIKGNLILKGAKKLRVASIVPTSVNAFRNVNGVEPENIVHDAPKEEVHVNEINQPFDFSTSLSGVENKTLDKVETSTPAFNTNRFQNEEKLNDYFNGNLSNVIDLDAYKRELEDLERAKADLREMDKNVEEVRGEIVDFNEILATQRRKLQEEKAKISNMLLDKTAEYKDLRAQLIQMKELSERNNPGLDENSLERKTM